MTNGAMPTATTASNGALGSKPLRLAVVSWRDLRSRNAHWPHYMVDALARAGASIRDCSPLGAPNGLASVWPRWARQNGRSSHASNGDAMRRVVEALGSQLEDDKPDLVFAPAGATIVPHLPDDISIVYTSDTTARLMRGYYPRRHALSSTEIDRMEANEAASIERAACVLYPTHWAARSAVEDYGADPSKVHVIPWGANLDSPGPALNGRRQPREPYRLLFVGVDWHRKGGEIAMQTVQHLRDHGLDVRLTICGCRPPKRMRSQYVRIIARLNKDRRRHRAKLESLYRTHDLLLFPTRAECLGLVSCEAFAFGMPVVAADTGGVQEAVEHDQNGVLMPISAEAAEYAAAVRSLLADTTQYERLSSGARAAFETTWNWNAWAVTTLDIIQQAFRTRACA